MVSQRSSGCIRWPQQFRCPTLWEQTYRGVCDHGETYRRNHAGRRHRQPGASRGDPRARRRGLRRRLTCTPTSAGSPGGTKATRCPSAPSSCCASTRSGLFGAITSKPKKETEAELIPSAEGKGLCSTSAPSSRCGRSSTSTSACVPACRFPGNPLNFIRKRPDGGYEEPKVDVVVFRQNTEGLYAGVEWTNPPAARARRARHASQVQAVRQCARRRSRRLGAHHHAAGGASHLRGGLPARRASSATSR